MCPKVVCDLAQASPAVLSPVAPFPRGGREPQTWHRMSGRCCSGVAAASVLTALNS